MSEPLIRATRRAYRASERYKLDQLLAEKSRWQRKVTVAQNKLADVHKRLAEFASELVKGEHHSPPTVNESEKPNENHSTV